MDRTVVIAAAVVVLAVAGTIGAGIGFVLLSNDPAIEIQRECASGQLGPPGGCKNLVVTARTKDRVDYTFELSDGTRCEGYQHIARGPLWLPAASDGGATCPGQPMPPVGPSPTPMAPDGNLLCTNVSLVMVPVEHGFQVVMTNASGTTCEVEPVAKVLFLDNNGQPLNVGMEISTEVSSTLVLAPGAAAVYSFESNTGNCQAPAAILFINPATTQQLASPGRLCFPVLEHPARPI